MRKRDFDRFLTRLGKSEGVKFVRITFVSGEAMLVRPYGLRYEYRGAMYATRMPTGSAYRVPQDLVKIGKYDPCPRCGVLHTECTHTSAIVSLRLRDVKRLDAVKGMTLEEVLESLEKKRVAYYRMNNHRIPSGSLSVHGDGPFYNLFNDRSGARFGGMSVRMIMSFDEVLKDYEEIVGQGGFFLSYWDARAEVAGVRPEALSTLLDGEVKELSRDLARLLEKSSFDLVRMADELRASLSVGGV